MNDPCCTAKQVEKKSDGSELHRCVNRKAKTFLLPVANEVCSMCPVRKPCQKSEVPVTQAMPIINGYPLCEHRVWRNNDATCSVSGLPVTAEICSRCDEEARERIAKMGDKLTGYASALRKWIAAGRPVRNEREQKRIREEHCLKCEMYDKDKDACKNCGCSLAMTGNPLTSKLAMGTEQCPLGRWGPTYKEPE